MAVNGVGEGLYFMQSFKDSGGQSPGCLQALAPKVPLGIAQQQKGQCGGCRMEVSKSRPRSGTHPFYYTSLELNQLYGHIQQKGGWKTRKKQDNDEKIISA